LTNIIIIISFGCVRGEDSKKKSTRRKREVTPHISTNILSRGAV